MRTNGEAVSLTIGETTVKIGECFAMTGNKDSCGRSQMHLWFRPYWPGVMHAGALIQDRKKAQ